MNAPANTANITALRQQSAIPREAQLPAVIPGFGSLQSFELMQRVAKAFAMSDLAPKQYQGNLGNCMIALDMAQRIGANPLQVMQNLYIVHGSPGWSSKFLIATINASGRYSSLRYEWKGEAGTPEFGCRAWAVERESGHRLDGIWVTWEMVKKEGWAGKNGSKWLTMPDQMFIYRAATFWQRAYAPEIGMGLQTAEEIVDAIEARPDAQGVYTADIETLKTGADAQAGTSDAPDEKTKPEKPAPTAAAPATTDAEIVNAETGEITSGATPIGIEDALAAVKSGDFDLALDLTRGLSEEERKAILEAIGKKKMDDRKNRRQPSAPPAFEME
ncbi:MAG: hypothetical protein LBF93_04350 [Zoogloeaceae bacterium]|jgi:hypothetical protein|nr:hypothetical protein [Zoogloeaceae bacterium]